MLGASTIFCSVIAFVSLVYCILMCVASYKNGCCGGPQVPQTPQTSIKSSIEMQAIPTTDMEAVNIQVPMEPVSAVLEV
jgi:hypothetical protein